MGHDGVVVWKTESVCGTVRKKEKKRDFQKVKQRNRNKWFLSIRGRVSRCLGGLQQVQKRETLLHTLAAASAATCCILRRWACLGTGGCAYQNGQTGTTVSKVESGGGGKRRPGPATRRWSVRITMTLGILRGPDTTNTTSTTVEVEARKTANHLRNQL
jgi:hypothetical protein